MQWVWHGRVVFGGSTLTMQVARMLESVPHSFSGATARVLQRVLEDGTAPVTD